MNYITEDEALALDGVLGIFAGDIHLSHRPPLWRAAEPDWYAAMRRPLVQLRRVADHHRVPVFYDGDIFDRWCPPPELINFALTYLPPGYAVPGQHDLPQHNFADMRRSAFWTLVHARHLSFLAPNRPEMINDIAVWGVPWEQPIPPAAALGDGLRVAIVHAYVWQEGSSYVGAPEERRVGVYAKNLEGYTHAFFGDNHRGFLGRAGRCRVCNTGTFYRRKSDEVDYTPSVCLLLSDGTVRRMALDTAADVYTPAADLGTLAESVGMSEFIDEIKDLSDAGLDFPEAVRRVAADAKAAPGVSKLLREVLDAAGN